MRRAHATFMLKQSYRQKFLLCKVQDYAKSSVIGAHIEGLKGSDHLP
jgi:hypothetical protein